VLCKAYGNTFEEQQFIDLNQYEVLVSLLESGANSTPFRARTMEPLECLIGRKENLIARSRERFAVTRSSVEDKFGRWVEEKD